jgi:hypothetical protein
MPLWYRIIRIWLPIAVATTAVCGVIVVSVQQNYRTSLNDPQIQLAHDAAARLDAGATPASVVNSPTVDADRSLAPFLVVYSPANAVLASGAALDGTAPTPPSGVLQAARDQTGGPSRIAKLLNRSPSQDNRVTWQPRQGVRLASVSVGAKDGIVILSARNMREVEARESDLALLVGFGWLAALGGALATTAVVELLAGHGAVKSARG